MLQHIFGRKQRKREEEELRRIQLLRDLSALRQNCKRNIDDAYSDCREEVHAGGPLMSQMATSNAHLMKNNAALLHKCDNTLLCLQNGELRQKAAIIDRLNGSEFKATYQETKKAARKNNTLKIRKRAQKLEKYRSICNWNRSVINDCLQESFDEMFEESDDSDDDSDVARFVEGVKEQVIIDKVLAAPNPVVSIVDDTESENHYERKNTTSKQ